MDAIIKKYPRTRHLVGSRLQPGDEDLEQVPWSSLAGRHIVVEEKVDGANSGISFADDGALLLQSRGHFLTGGPREQQFSLFKQWAAVHTDVLREALGTRFVLYGEWLFAKHTVFYDALPHYFVEYDVLDKQSGHWLGTSRRRELLASTPVESVPVLYEGVHSKPIDVLKQVARSSYVSVDVEPGLRQSCDEIRYDVARARAESDVSGIMEGLYIKIEEEDCVQERLKWVRPEFLQAMLNSGSHWQDRPILPNRLRDGVDIWSGRK